MINSLDYNFEIPLSYIKTYKLEFSGNLAMVDMPKKKVL